MPDETAPAKINLYLHVGPRRRDHLHELKSLFVFADDGDRISVEPARDLSLSIEGPFSGPLRAGPAATNLVLRAARRLQSAAGVDRGARITLDKRLPIAAGVGGGSADAAATLRALMKLWALTIPAGRLKALAFALGADVPACLSGAPVFVGGAGEIVSPAPRLPPLAICLVNPRVAMPTGPVFRAFDEACPAPSPPRHPPVAALSTIEGLRAALSKSRNDLQPFAITREPVVARVIDRLSSAAGALPARLSGSGATVFSLFASRVAAARAAQAMRAEGWWALDAAIAGAGAP